MGGTDAGLGESFGFGRGRVRTGASDPSVELTGCEGRVHSRLLLGWHPSLLIYYRPNTFRPSYNSMMTRYFSRGGNPRPPYFYYRARASVRNSIIHCLRSFLLLKFFLSFFSQKTLAYCGSRKFMTSIWYPSF